MCVSLFTFVLYVKKVKKICESFRATLYPCPDTPTERREMSVGVMTRIEDLNTVLRQTQDHRHRVLAAAAKNIQNWFVPLSLSLSMAT